jgi:prohead core protein serine protease
MNKLLLEFNSATHTSGKISGIFLRSGQKNRNNRIYLREACEQNANRIQQMIREGKCLGALDHPDGVNTPLDKVSHTVIVLKRIDDDTWEGTAKLLDTPAGRIARTLIEDKSVSVGISSRSTGVTRPGPNGVQLVESFQLHAFDLVSSPSTINGWVHGLQEHALLTESVNETQLVQNILKKYSSFTGSAGNKYALEIDDSLKGLANFLNLDLTVPEQYEKMRLWMAQQLASLNQSMGMGSNRFLADIIKKETTPLRKALDKVREAEHEMNSAPNINEDNSTVQRYAGFMKRNAEFNKSEKPKRKIVRHTKSIEEQAVENWRKNNGK